MASGVEVAGLVLAAFPLVLHGLEAYSDGVRSAKRLVKHQRPLESLALDVRVEYELFGTNCDIFLRDIDVSDFELSALKESPGGKCWTTWDIKLKLMEAGCYSASIVEVLVELVFEMGLALEALKKKLSLDGQNKAIFQGGVTRRAMVQKWIISVGYQGCIGEVQRMTNLNRQLQGLCGTPTILLSSAPKLFKGAAKHYDRVRMHAINLYQALEEKILTKPLCACVASHAASLQLEARWLSERPKGPKPPESKPQLRFRVALSHMPSGEDATTRWKTLEAEPLESEDETTHHPAITLSKALSEKPLRGDALADGLFVHGQDARPQDRSRPTSSLSPKWGFRPRRNSCNPGDSQSDHGEDQRSDDGNSIATLNRSYRSPMLSALRLSSRKKKAPKKARFVNESCAPASVSLVVQANSGCPGSLPNITAQATCTTSTTQNVDATMTDEQIREMTGNLCVAICNAIGERTCLGIVVSNAMKQRLWYDQKCFQSTSVQKFVSLADILPKLEKRDSIILAIKLASTVMQLHATEWLPESWGASDIVFPAPENGNHSWDLQRPLLRKTLQQKTIAKDRSLIQSFVYRDETLYSLGIVLLELHYGKPVHAILNPNFSAPPPDQRSEAATERHVMQCVAKLEKDFPPVPDYARAVYRCISQGGLGTSVEKTGLHVKEFKNEVQSKIMFPLESYLQNQFGKSLAEVFS